MRREDEGRMGRVVWSAGHAAREASRQVGPWYGPVDDSLSVQVLQREQELGGVEARSVLVKLALLLQMFEQLRPAARNAWALGAGAPSA